MKTGELDEVGGPAYLASLSDGVPRSANIVHYAEIVREKARLRDAIHTANKLLAASYLAERAIARDRRGGGGIAARPVRRSVWRETDPARRHDGVLHGSARDESCCRNRRDRAGDRVRAAGRNDRRSAPGEPTGHRRQVEPGKNRAGSQHRAERGAGFPVLMFSLEMAKEEIFERMLATESRVDSHRLRTGHLTDGEWTRIANGMGALSEMKMYVDDDANVGVREIRARARQMKKENGLGLIVVDYLQLMKSSGKFDTRTQEVGSFSRGLKRIAKELKVPLAALSQLSRASEAGPGRKARRPQLSDLRESGDIEADADVVLLIYRPEPKDGETPIAELIIAKQRNGPTGTVKVSWDAASVTFDSTGMV
jgi:replicative DNA helicase